MDVPTLNFLLACGTVAMQLVTAAVLAAYIFPKTLPSAETITTLVGRWGMMCAFILSLASAIMTLIYSDILGFEPCPLCWWQRIFLYPQVVILGMALWKPFQYKVAALDFSIVLSVCGAGFALYHHLLQVMPSGSLPCPATGPSCAQLTIFEFGYVTFPMMALALFALNIVVFLVLRSRS